MEQGRHTTVLFADVSGSTSLYESVGDKVAMDAIARCLAALRAATEKAGGRVVKTIGDEVMALFAHPDAAGAAACAMQLAIDALPAVGATRLAVRVGFHCGPVIQNDDNDIFGDTVNMASRLVEQAGRSQIITSRETAERLGPALAAEIRPLYGIHVKGKAEEVGLCELIWRKAGEMTVSLGLRTITRQQPVLLRLKHQGREIVRRRDNDSITIGREPDCGLVIAASMASRHHCVIERRQDKFILCDQSTNGTFVTPEGDTEHLLQREEFTLGKHGWISFGQPLEGTEEMVEYFCDSVG